MAGIGFHLQKLLKGKTYTEWTSAYLYGAIISAGPMLVVIWVLALFKIFAYQQVHSDDFRQFYGIIIYIYAFSMIGMAPLLFVITRHIADRYY
ncbi:MAG TPA: hypothetical protein DF383_04395, partial [Deltaproteobacteria bacterium]|nr:hypothetical protein [Deltaproteobacteria bacterium]